MDASLLVDEPLRDLLTALASPKPTPGGGSASALASAIGVSLLIMVASLPRTRRGTDEDRTALAASVASLAALRQQLEDAIDADAAAYDLVIAAIRQPKGSVAEQQARNAAVQRALSGAAAVPLDVMRWSAAGLREAESVATHGQRTAASDVGVALGLLRAGLEGALLNVRVNLEQLTDVGNKDRIGAEADRLQREAIGLIESAGNILK